MEGVGIVAFVGLLLLASSTRSLSQGSAGERNYSDSDSVGDLAVKLGTVGGSY